ncbi:AraC family transcriptional regulator [Halarcobacter mediterraneus]|uniref:AraC family transcriptional regulator n=1 Tax=Halarcobacter mediterraneus TaxID=2023153 RepID=A0A4Q1AZS4_9BACT|nr:GyrI-like domain-containing protein [Halarcobacter mediterraneus]RXK14520.1 AraC family transcriptional regulator [Halarcobacter mediterraneus]
MKVKYLEKFYVAGISTRTNNEIEFSEEGKIPALWQQYVDENIESKTFNKAKNMAMYGVYNKYENDVNSDYDYTIGVEVTKPKNAITIEKDKYLVFSKKGEFPEVVIETWKEIWAYFESESCEYERAYNFDFEKYAKEDEIEIYISIK